jgi:hypothetical protein
MMAPPKEDWKATLFIVGFLALLAGLFVPVLASGVDPILGAGRQIDPEG